MTTLKTWLGGIGIVTVLVGGSSFPLGMGINPERDTSIFHNLADLGLFIEYGFVLILLGIVLIVVSLLIPSRTGHEE
jgi:hypothetical protein